MITLSDTERSRIEHEGHVPIEDGAYVVLKAEEYARLRSLVEGGLEMRQVGALVEAAMREDDLADPLLESYQRHRP